MQTWKVTDSDINRELFLAEAEGIKYVKEIF